MRDVPRGMLDHVHFALDLKGPASHTSFPGMISTPHWSIPPNITAPYSMLRPFHIINVTDVHMPSLLHMLKFVRHLAYTSSVFDSGSKINRKAHDPANGYLGDGLYLDKLKWDSGERRHYPFHFRSPNLCRRLYDPQAFANFYCDAQGCTSDICLCTSWHMRLLLARLVGCTGCRNPSKNGYYRSCCLLKTSFSMSHAGDV